MTTPNLNPEGLRALAEKATPGPWAWDEQMESFYNDPEGHSCGGGGTGLAEVFRDGDEDTSITDRARLCDAAFIAACREAVPALLDENERMRAALERLASSEAFDLPQAIDGPLAQEMRDRLDYARAALSPTQPEEVK